MKGKELGRGVIGMWRAPQSLSAARNFDQNGHVATIVTNVDPFESRETKNGAQRWGNGHFFTKPHAPFRECREGKMPEAKTEPKAR